MFKLIKKTSKMRGLAPGSLVHIGERISDKTRISVIDYDQEHLHEQEVNSIEECLKYKDSKTVTWINIDGLHDLELMEKIGQGFNLHPLTLEDIVNTSQRPKYEDFEDYIFIVLKMFYHDSNKDEIASEQVSLILGNNYVLSFQEKQGDVFDYIRERIRKAKGRIRKSRADYLVYSLMDAIIDNYFVILEGLGEEIEDMEEDIVANPSTNRLQIIHHLKREFIYLRKSVWPLREVINGLERGESKLISKQTHVFLRDIYDHTIQVIDTLESFRDMVSGMLDIYMTSVSNKMNEVMKVLTIIATIFIPITFVAGIYGMNFNPEISPWNMPELNWRFGYPAVWGIIIIITVLMLIYFKRKKWL